MRPAPGEKAWRQWQRGRHRRKRRDCASEDGGHARAEIAELARACAAGGNDDVLADFLDGRLSLAEAYRALDLAAKPAAASATLEEALLRAAATIDGEAMWDRAFEQARARFG
jgi:hypothetical protein